jgi:hypothetical protein
MPPESLLHERLRRPPNPSQPLHPQHNPIPLVDATVGCSGSTRLAKSRGQRRHATMGHRCGDARRQARVRGVCGGEEKVAAALGDGLG